MLYVVEYGHVALRVLSASFTLERSYNMLAQVVEVTANEKGEADNTYRYLIIPGVFSE